MSRSITAGPAGEPGEQPVVVQVRLIGPPAAVARAAAAHAEAYGPLWQPSGTPQPSRRGGTDVLLYGTLIVPVAPR